MLIPFGAAVIFKPSPTKGHVDKPLPTGQQGIFWDVGLLRAANGTASTWSRTSSTSPDWIIPAMPSGMLECYHHT